MDFGAEPSRTCTARLRMPAGSSVELRLDRPDGPSIGRIEAGEAEPGTWQVLRSDLKPTTGIHTLYLDFDTRGKSAENRMDWFRFE